MMRRVTGPECPRCGCTEADVGPQYDRWGREAQRRHCVFCRHAWIERIRPRVADQHQTRPEPATSNRPGDTDGVAVYWVAVPPVCPECGGDTRTIQTTRPMRRHKCNDCGEVFKSTERSPV